MRSTAYDLVCEKCRRKFDRIFSVKIESAEQERKLLTKWLARALANEYRKAIQHLPISKTTGLEELKQ